MEFSEKQSLEFEEKLKRGYEAIVFEDFPDASVAMDFVNYCLSMVYTEGAFIYWWNKPNKALEGRSPLDVWAVSPQKVINIAVQLADL